MLGLLRRKKNSPIIAFLLGLIIIVFVAFFGNSWSNCAQEHLYAAKVNGRTISDQEYAALYATEFRNRQGQDAKFDRDKARRDNLRESVLNRMITQTILAQNAQDRGLAVDKQALKDSIVSNPNFQTDGKFDRRLYERILNSQQLTDFRFENQLKQGILAQKIASLVENSIGVSDAEAKDFFFQERRRVNLEFVQLKKDAYQSKVGTVTPADAEEWMKQPAADEQIKKFYEKHARTRYNTPKQVCAQHILVRSEKEAPPDLKKKAQDKIVEAAKAVRDGMDFAEAAKKYSDDSTKDKGGDLGCFSTGQMVPQFEEAAFGMKVGEVSNRIDTPFGFHIIKVTDIKPPVEKKLEDVKKEIALEIVASAKAGELAKKRAEEINAAAVKAKSLEEALSSAKPAKGHADPVPFKVEETGPFPKRDFIPRIGLSKEIGKVAWELTPEKPVPATPFETDTAWYVIRLKDKIEPTDQEFENDKKMAMLTLGYQKRNSVIKGWTEQLRQKAKVAVHPLALSYDDEARAQARGPNR